MKKSIYQESERYYAENYETIFRQSFETEGKDYLKDHDDGSPRLCRFCGKGIPEVSFKNTAHAVPEFLGNRDIISLNECDSCNSFFALNYEDHLSKWSLYARATSQIRSKRGKPKYHNLDGTLQIKSGESGLDIRLTDPDLFKKISTSSEPFSFRIPVDASSQKFIPLNAAKALVKAACSVCPFIDLKECKQTIDWLLNRTNMNLSTFPVLYMFTPGPLGNEVSEIILLKRKTDENIPYLWCVIQFGHHRLETFIPFCKPDQNWLSSEKTSRIIMHYYPSQFGTDWEYGEEKSYAMDWSSEKEIQTFATASFHVKEWTQINPSADTSGD